MKLAIRRRESVIPVEVRVQGSSIGRQAQCALVFATVTAIGF